MKNIALIMAAGKSSRCGFDKLVAQLGEMTILERCLQTFEACDAIQEIWVVGKTEVDLNFKVDLEGSKLQGFIPGGDTRFQSVKNGLEHCQKNYSNSQGTRIIVHNAANPYLSKVDLENGLKQSETKPNLIFGFFSPNSIKQVGADGQVTQFLNRTEIFETQTPQIAPLSTFTMALEAWDSQIPGSTSRISADPGINEPRDEAELLALIDEPVHVYECDPSNTKVTFSTDLPSTIHHPPFTRLGVGEDSHRFGNYEPDKPFCLGGVDMSEGRLSSEGNSDGDIILHALCNALLSAHGDTTFDPIAAPLCQAGDTNSVSYLEATLEHLTINHSPFTINQLLISLEGAQPKIAPQHQAITKNLAQLLNITPEQIGLTYTTGEALTSFGKGEGIRSWVLVVLKRTF